MMADTMSFTRLALSCVFLAAITLAAPCVRAQASQEDVWRKLELPKPDLRNFGVQESARFPVAVLDLNRGKLGQLLQKVPAQFTPEAQEQRLELTIPLPTGELKTFRIEETTVAEGEFRETTAQVRTFAGMATDDPTTVVRFEVSFGTFRAMVRSPFGVSYVAPGSDFGFNSGPRAVPYFAFAEEMQAPKRNPRERHCELSDELVRRELRRKLAARSKALAARPKVLPPIGDALRVYRLALAANSFYVAAVYDPKLPASPHEQAAAAIKATVNRLNGIYGSELGIQFVLIGQEGKIIFADPKKDPYADVNSKDSAAIDKNQAVLDNIIGTNNYDIGHLFTTDTAGLAVPGSVCSTEYKARAVTGIAAPVGDNFDVDYVAHEVGHQLGASHTFNGTRGGCSGNRHPETAYEPGSGSTIMAYAGVCEDENLQLHTDPYFHAASLAEIGAYVLDGTEGSGGSCGSLKPIKNARPVITVGGPYTVPKGTAFVLDARPTLASSSDKLTYVWEELDLGAPGPPNDENGPNPAVRPLFRSIRPSDAVLRVLPKLSSVLKPPNTFSGEALPMVAADRRFRVTARNNNGAFSFADISVTIDQASGPVTVGTRESRWKRGTCQQITWDPAHSNESPVGVKNVRLRLVLDGNANTTLPIADSTPNNGAYCFAIPSNFPLSAHGRVRLDAVPGIFFAVSSSDIEIVP